MTEKRSGIERISAGSLCDNLFGIQTIADAMDMRIQPSQQMMEFAAFDLPFQRVLA